MLGEHLLDRGEGVILDGVKLFAQLLTGVGIQGSAVGIGEEDEGVFGTADLEIVLGEDLDAVERCDGGGSSSEEGGGSVGTSGIGGLGGDQDLSDSRLHGCNCQQAGDDEDLH